MKKTNTMFWLATAAFSAAMGTTGCAADTSDEEDLVAGEEMEDAGEVEEVGEAQDALVVSNPSFETGPAPGSFITLPTGNTQITGWTVGGGGIDYIGTLWSHKDGSRSIDLNALSAGSISKTFSTVVNTTYTVSFWMAGHPGGVQGTKTLQVWRNGVQSSNTFSHSTVGKSYSNMGWTKWSHTFKATTTSTTLTFKSTTSGSYGPALDGPITITP